MSRTTLPLGLAFLALSAAAALGAEPPLKEAALNLAVAAKCRAQLGDERMFDVAFQRLQGVAHGTPGGPTDQQLEEWRGQLLAETPAAPEPMIPEMCGALRAFLIPE